jgi:gliding motility-associated-like protein
VPENQRNKSIFAYQLIMRVSTRNIVAVLCLVVFPAVFLFAEGTKQIMPDPNAKGQLCINKFRNPFAFSGADPEFRLNISIANTYEEIRFGFQKAIDIYTSNLVYRIVAPDGTPVFDWTPIPSSGEVGYINTYEEAVAGPFPTGGGYNYRNIQPQKTGDYYLEFSYPAGASEIYDNNNRKFKFFDITVVDASQKTLNGRIWSKAWQFWSENPDYDYNRFYGKLMILSDDSIVTQVNCNGFRGGTFSFSSNMTGCSTTGNLLEDRKSTKGFFTYPQYKVFLNDPDNSLYPTQKAPSGVILPVAVNANCNTGGAEFGIKMEKNGTVNLLIRVNPSLGSSPADVHIISDLKANPGGNGYNYIVWDGNDNFGNPVANGSSLSYTVTILSGMTHLPIYDIERNDYGFIVNQIRPAGGQLRIYWDDSKITEGTSNMSNGCINPSGCHNWTNVNGGAGFGDYNTINSWWFVSGSETAAVTFSTKRYPAIPVLSGNTVHCMGTIGTLDFFVANDPNSTSYKWSYSGTGVTIATSGTTATLSFAADATAGILSVNGQNASCGDGPATYMNITFESLPSVSLEPFTDMCYTAPGFKLTGGEPQGGTYFVHGIEADSILPYKEPEGFLPVAYTYTTSTGCPNSDTSGILLTSGAECLGAVYFPNAFKPENDSVNNQFRPVVRNISTFTMYIYNRWGQLVFSTDNAAKGWDGTYKDKPCPAGTYTFISTYGLSLREDNIETKRGVLALIR